jgi:hypothetical protein
MEADNIFHSPGLPLVGITRGFFLFVNLFQIFIYQGVPMAIGCGKILTIFWQNVRFKICGG